MKRATLIIASIIGLLAVSGCGESGYPIIYEKYDGVTQNPSSSDNVINVKYLIQTKDMDSAVNDIRHLELKVAKRHKSAEMINVFIYADFNKISVLNESGERFTGIQSISATTCSTENIKKYPDPAEYEKFRQEQLKEKLVYRLRDQN